ncbi:hypothetical protein AT251_09880 [Enterovibrio nigricans]|nr:hypothetical protein [Enterovibrio nigricans]PKF50675.1 hypothetical protein AT251_09880 [Enterovibrio nigricans]
MTCLRENNTPDNTHHFMNAKHRNGTSFKLHTLAHFAHDLGEPELAGLILNAAEQLGADAQIPAPM